MPTASQTLSRAPLHRLDDLIPETVEEVLQVIENESISSRRKTEIALRINPPEKLLREKEHRDQLFNLLDPEEAEELVDELGFVDVDNPYVELRNSQYYRGTEREEILFEFFDVELPEDNDEDSKPGLISLYPEYGLFDYQRNVSDRIETRLDSSDNRVFLHMPTGSGKTRITMNTVCNVVKNSEPGLVLWLAEGQELLDQAAEEFETAWNHLGNREVEISRFYGSYDWDKIEEGFVVAGLQKLWNKQKSEPTFLPNFSNDISLVVFDEAHRSVANIYQKMLDRLMFFNEDCGLMGLSATPGRSYDDRQADRKLVELYNQNKVSIDVPGHHDPFEFLTSEGYLSEPEFNKLKMNRQILAKELVQELEGLSRGQEYPSRALERLAEDDFRNIRITKKVLDLIDEGHNRIILFATTVDHARIISAVLKAQGVKSSVITSETPSYIREREINRYTKKNNTPRVLCNYSVLTTGFNAPQTSATVIARPTTSLVLYSQMVGRAIRGPEVGGTKEAEIWTVIDTELPGFGDLAEAFWNWEDVW
jgi:superfamily II DNA or RNA helicase